MMTFDEYQDQSRSTAMYPKVAISLNGQPFFEAPWLYPILGLVEEAGELAGKFKKLLRDDNGEMKEERQTAIIAELGDVKWYVARLADAVGVRLVDVAKANLKKLFDRMERGVLGGSGDNR